jgi:hypothetical protein
MRLSIYLGGGGGSGYFCVKKAPSYSKMLGISVVSNKGKGKGHTLE